jgi:hypothetical protein
MFVSLYQVTPRCSLALCSFALFLFRSLEIATAVLSLFLLLSAISLSFDLSRLLLRCYFSFSSLSSDGAVLTWCCGAPLPVLPRGLYMKRAATSMLPPTGTSLMINVARCSHLTPGPHLALACHTCVCECIITLLTFLYLLPHYT